MSAPLNEFVKQFIAAAVAPTETSPKSIKHHYDNWRQYKRKMEENMLELDEKYEKDHNQPRIAIESARRQFEAQSGIYKDEAGKDNSGMAFQEYCRFLNSRPISKPSEIFTRHMLE